MGGHMGQSTRPISASMLALALILVCMMVLPVLGRRRREVFAESED
jgi:hypothetical protein